MAEPLPVAPRGGPIAIHVATMADLPFLDAMQKQFGRALGYFPTKQFEGYIEGGHVLVAVGATLVSPGVVRAGDEGETSLAPTGYVISKDRYLKRDELGVIYQLCVAPGFQRSLVGASLIKAVFERSAYGCRLYCCWCAQDLAANYFWESLGFVPIAFRAGSTGKKRVHIFWQRRIDPSESMTTHQSPAPYWYPCATNGGAIREDRLVFPIPPGTHWSEVQAVAIPSAGGLGILPEPAGAAPRRRADRRSSGETPEPRETQSPLETISSGGLFFAPPQPLKPEKPKRARPERPKVKVDPALVAKARELRDRYLEQVNDRLLLAPRGKYDVSRRTMLPQAPGPNTALLLPAA